ncbi:hypothetical protein HZA87_05385 [Candidatus Uhrbacteria bacterium]|nr:hypothetical protein [Candidatus Uhrbacteria bacterium]
MAIAFHEREIEEDEFPAEPAKPRLTKTLVVASDGGTTSEQMKAAVMRVATGRVFDVVRDNYSSIIGPSNNDDIAALVHFLHAVQSAFEIVETRESRQLETILHSDAADAFLIETDFSPSRHAVTLLHETKHPVHVTGMPSPRWARGLSTGHTANTEEAFLLGLHEGREVGFLRRNWKSALVELMKEHTPSTKWQQMLACRKKGKSIHE